MRSLVRLLLAVLVVGIALQCQDRQGPTEVDSTGLETAITEEEQDILDLLGEIFDGRNETASKSQANNIFRQKGRSRIADAQAKAIDLVDFILDKQAEGHTTGTDEQVNEVISLILTYVGYEVDYEGGEDSGIGVCSPDADCEVVTGNDNAGAHCPAGCFSQDVVIIIELLPDFEPEPIGGLSPAVSTFYPLPTGHKQYPQFYDIRTIPDGVELNAGFFADIGLCVLEQSDGWEQGAPDDVLDDLVLAHPAPGEGNCDDDIECLPIVNVAGLIDCGDLEDGPELTGFPGLLDDFTRTLVSPFSPSLLYASPGDLGGQASSFSPFAAVDPTFEDGFEDGLAWTATGFWNLTNGAVVDNAAEPTYVSLAPDDVSAGALPSAPEGSWYIWYGVTADGNYMGTQAAEDPPGSGGTSTAANSGTMTSPAFNVPSTLSNPTLTFDAWFEIESVNPAGFDQMIVSVIDLDAETVTELGRLNPASDPGGGSAPLPFTSSGFNLAPSFIERSFSLAAFSGNTIQIVFTFATGDHLYNGFRGLIIDDVEVVEGSFLSGLTPASTTTSSLAANRAACGQPVCPGFPQRENR